MDRGKLFLELREHIKNEDVKAFFEAYKKDPSVLEEHWDKKGRTLLHRIAASRNFSFLRGLMHDELNWRVKSLFSSQCTPMHMAAMYGSFWNIINLLKLDKELRNLTDNIQNVPLHYAVYKKRNVLSLLTRQTTIPLNIYGETPLHRAVIAYKEEKYISKYSDLLPTLFFYYVKKFGFRIVDIKDNRGNTPLETGKNTRGEAWKYMQEWILKIIDIAPNLEFYFSFHEIYYINRVIKRKMPESLRELKREFKKLSKENSVHDGLSHYVTQVS